MKKYIALSVLGIFFVSSTAFAAFPTLSVVPLITDPAHQFFPDISGEKVVFNDYRSGYWEVYAYDLRKQTEQQITNTMPLHGMQNPRVSGDVVVWTDQRDGQIAVYSYNLLTNQEKKLLTNSSLAPAIDGKSVVWMDYVAGDIGNEIYHYNLKNNKLTRLTNDSFDQQDPDVSGRYVVWSDLRNGVTNADIYLYDLKTKAVRVVSNAPGNQKNPRVSGNSIVWMDYRKGTDISNAEIYIYDIATGQERALTDDLVAQGYPVISGSKVAWSDNTFEPASDVVVYDTVTEQKVWMAQGDGFTQTRPAIDGNNLVWMDYRNGIPDIYKAIW